MALLANLGSIVVFVVLYLGEMNDQLALDRSSTVWEVIGACVFMSMLGLMFFVVAITSRQPELVLGQEQLERTLDMSISASHSFMCHVRNVQAGRPRSASTSSRGRSTSSLVPGFCSPAGMGRSPRTTRSRSLQREEGRSGTSMLPEHTSTGISMHEQRGDESTSA